MEQTKFPESKRGSAMPPAPEHDHANARIDSHSAGRHLERIPAQHSQTYDPLKEPTPR